MNLDLISALPPSAEETLAHLQKRLETSFEETRCALEEVKKLRSNLSINSKEDSSTSKPTSTRPPAGSTSWIVRWVARIVLLFMLALVFLPGLLPLYLALSGRSMYNDPLASWSFGINTQAGEVLWTLWSIASGAALLIALLLTFFVLMEIGFPMALNKTSKEERRSR